MHSLKYCLLMFVGKLANTMNRKKHYTVNIALPVTNNMPAINCAVSYASSSSCRNDYPTKKSFYYFLLMYLSWIQISAETTWTVNVNRKVYNVGANSVIF
ncbi:unnamed protein product [Orchesella dallaii]|uniref:Uncharacterized protein n=1 Tax=Orchesella dallaii TaxID=48710 RepID=A0ABP1PQQ0_9HEXA